jgi:hypothetical protein
MKRPLCKILVENDQPCGKELKGLEAHAETIRQAERHVPKGFCIRHDFHAIPDEDQQALAEIARAELAKK